MIDVIAEENYTHQKQHGILVRDIRLPFYECLEFPR
jgi:hypothetical protein